MSLRPFQQPNISSTATDMSIVAAEGSHEPLYMQPQHCPVCAYVTHRRALSTKPPLAPQTHLSLGSLTTPHPPLKIHPPPHQALHDLLMPKQRQQQQPQGLRQHLPHRAPSQPPINPISSTRQLPAAAKLAPAAAGAGSPSPQVATTLVHSSAGHNGSSRQGITAADTSPTLPRGKSAARSRKHQPASPPSCHQENSKCSGVIHAVLASSGQMQKQALSEPQWAPSFNSTSPLIPQGPLLDSQQLNATQQHLEQQGHGYSGQQGAGEFEEEDEARRGDGGGEGEWGPNGSWIPSSEAADGVGHLPQQQQQYHPRMATSMPLHVQDIHDGAAASLAASKQAAANGLQGKMLTGLVMEFRQNADRFQGRMLTGLVMGFRQDADWQGTDWFILGDASGMLIGFKAGCWQDWSGGVGGMLIGFKAGC
eukprot:scaffold119194_cov20-Tisochrysis_lutea.AAC.2